MVNLKVNYDEYIPLRDIVFKTLREAIITGDLKPGERLMEIKLANELGVSRTPVREAIRKLELEAPSGKPQIMRVVSVRTLKSSSVCLLTALSC